MGRTFYKLLDTSRSFSAPVTIRRASSRTSVSAASRRRRLLSVISLSSASGRCLHKRARVFLAQALGCAARSEKVAESGAAKRMCHRPIRCNPSQDHKAAFARAETVRVRLVASGDTLPAQTGTVRWVSLRSDRGRAKRQAPMKQLSLPADPTIAGGAMFREGGIS